MTIPETAGFLARVRETPDDDGPRLIFADWLDGVGQCERGEFIRVQVALARLADTDPRRPDLLRAEAGLLGDHADAWAEPFRGLATGPVFRRGFVEEVKVTARQFLARPAELFAAGPIRHLHLLDAASHLTAVTLSPHLERLTGLTIYGQHLRDSLAHAVAESPYLTRLRVLHLGRNPIGDRGLDRLARAAGLAELESLDLSENELGEPAGRTLAEAARFARLTRLELAGNALGPHAAAQIAGSPHLQNLTHLGLAGNRLGGPRLATAPDPTALLRTASVDLAGNDLGPAGLAAILGGVRTAGERYFADLRCRIGRWFDPGSWQT